MPSLQLKRALAVVAALVVMPLAVSACGGSPVADGTPTPTATSDAGVPDAGKDDDERVAPGFIDVFDDANVVTVQVPDTWTQTDGRAVVTAAGVEIYNLLASPDIEAYNTSWSVPGVTLGATQDLSASPESYLASVIANVGPDCGDSTGDLYDDGVYSGSYVLLPDCGGVGTDFLAVAATDATNTHIVIVQIQMVSDEDKSTNRDKILSTFLALF